LPFLLVSGVVFLLSTGILVLAASRRRRRKLAKILVPLVAGSVCGGVPMHEAEIRVRIRERLKSGALPRMLPASPLKSGVPPGAVNMQCGVISGATCLACGEADPTIMYSYPSGPVVRVHDACQVIWPEEREQT
jgi:hypothetical protein